MYKIILALILLPVTSLLSHAQTTNPDMTVFGYKLGEKLSVPECPCNIVQGRALDGSNNIYYNTRSNLSVDSRYSDWRYKDYQYATIEPVSGACFKRDLTPYIVKKKDQLNPLPALTNEVVVVSFARADAPEMCYLHSFDAFITNSKLTAVAFTISSNAANDIFEILKKKYGTNVDVKSYKLQNGYGASLDYYTAIWSFPNLSVTLLSSNHGNLSDPFGLVTIEMLDRNAAPPKPKVKL